MNPSDTVWRVRPTKRKGAVSEMHFGDGTLLFVRAWDSPGLFDMLADAIDIEEDR